MAPHPAPDRSGRPSPRGRWRAAELLRAETTGGLLLLGATAAALVWANTPWSPDYVTLRDWTVGPSALRLDLSLGEWAADGLLAIFFFVAGLELKRELVDGDLRDPRRALLPVAAAVGGMVFPALVFLLLNLGNGTLRGWAIPTATDIAFAVAVLAVISTHLPRGLRTFLLTLAVVDDLLAIIVIACFYTTSLHLAWLLLALVPLALFALLVRRPPASGVRRPALLLALAVLTWALVHASGIHPTVAGVALALTVPVLAPERDPDRPGPAKLLEHLLRPLSDAVAVPVFAFFSAGVALHGWDGLGAALRDPVALGIVAGLVLGKPVGITLATWLLATFTRAELDGELAWSDVIGLAMLGGVGFTVSLLIGELAFGASSTLDEHVTVGVLAGSVASGLLASLVLAGRNRHYRGLSRSTGSSPA